MNKWVIRKLSEPAAYDIAEVSEADELNDSELSAKKKKTRQWKNVTRKFQESWELKFVVMQQTKSQTINFQLMAVVMSVKLPV
jgi:hypothetical protein